MTQFGSPIPVINRSTSNPQAHTNILLPDQSLKRTESSDYFAVHNSSIILVLALLLSSQVEGGPGKRSWMSTKQHKLLVIPQDHDEKENPGKIDTRSPVKSMQLLRDYYSCLGLQKGLALIHRNGEMISIFLSRSDFPGLGISRAAVADKQITLMVLGAVQALQLPENELHFRPAWYQRLTSLLNIVLCETTCHSHILTI